MLERVRCCWRATRFATGTTRWDCGRRGVYDLTSPAAASWRTDRRCWHRNTSGGLALTPEGGTLITNCFEAEISAMIEADLVGIGPGRPPDPGFGW